MKNISDYSLTELKEYYYSIKETGKNPNEELFKTLPEVNIGVLNNKMNTSEEDTQKMLLWVVCKANIKDPN